MADEPLFASMGEARRLALQLSTKLNITLEEALLKVKSMSKEEFLEALRGGKTLRDA